MLMFVESEFILTCKLQQGDVEMPVDKDESIWLQWENQSENLFA